MALHDVMEDALLDGSDKAPWDELKTLITHLGNEAVAPARDELKKLVAHVDMIIDAPAFAGPGGMHDLPQILVTAYYARTAPTKFVENYRRAINRLHWLLLVVQAEWLLVPKEERDGEAARARIKEQVAKRIANKQETLKVPDRLQPRITLTGRDLLPTLAAITAAVGASVAPPPANDAPGNALRRFVEALHGELLRDASGLTQVRADAPASVQYLAHMHALLHDAAPRLAMGVLPCDRTPIVAPWYASAVLAARTYARVLVAVLGVPGVDEPTGVAFTLFSLMALSDPGVEADLSPDVLARLRPIGMRPFNSLCAARSKSMYVCAPTQSGPWWVLLRATLSGLSVDEADGLADLLIEVADQLEVVVRNAVMLCVLMHTQTGMRVVGRRSADGKDLASFPLAARVARVRDPSCGQTPLDLLMTTYSGTSDLASLATDDLAFNAASIKRQEQAWMQELAVRLEDVAVGAAHESSPSAAVIDETVRNFCAAMRAIGVDWLANCVRSVSEIAEAAGRASRRAHHRRDARRALSGLGVARDAALRAVAQRGLRTLRRARAVLPKPRARSAASARCSNRRSRAV